MKTFILSSIILLAAISFTSCSNEDSLTETSPTEFKGAFTDVIYTDSTFTTTAEDLTQADIDGLMLMREEEKLAHDVYVYFFELYDLQIFDRISSSESQHAEAVLALLNHFGLEDPTIYETGVFASEDLQALYNELIAVGEESVETALAVGALIEETDIEDLEILIAETENADLLTVYGHLLSGSFNHLKGFVRTLSIYSVVYEPQLLSQEAFDAILETANGNGNKDQGQGNRGQVNDRGQNNIDSCDSTGVGNGTPVSDGNGTKGQGQGNNGQVSNSGQSDIASCDSTGVGNGTPIYDGNDSQNEEANNNRNGNKGNRGGRN